MRPAAAVAAVALAFVAPLQAAELTFPEALARMRAANESLLAASEAVAARREERAAQLAGVRTRSMTRWALFAAYLVLTWVLLRRASGWR